MSNQSDLVGGEQNGQTVQPLVANQNDQNVKSLVGTKRARNPGKDKKYRGKKKQKTEDTERQLRADHAELKNKHDELKNKHDELKNTHAYSEGKLDQAKDNMELIKGCCGIMQQAVTTQNACINLLQQLLVAGTINQFGATMESGGLVVGESFPQSHQVERAHPGLAYGGDMNYTSQFGTTMAPGSSLMQGSLAPGGQPGLAYGGDMNYTSQFGAAMDPGSSLMQGSLAPGGQGNNSEQPPPI